MRIPAIGCAAAVVAALAVAPAVRAEPAAEAVGDSRDSLPGLGRVGVVEPLAAGWSLAWSGGYGYTESVVSSADAHHRVGGVLAASLRPMPGLAVALRLDGRYDRHTGGPVADDGWIGDTRLLARASRHLSRGLDAGGQLAIWFPGREPLVPTLDATSADLIGMLGAAITPAVRAAAIAGFRLDRSAKSAPDAARFSDADRLALGVSDSNAILLGLGAALRRGSIEGYGEWSWDLLVGDAAPSPMQSPMRLGAGARVRISDEWSAQAGLEVALSARPPVGAGDPLVPVEPRLSLTAGVVWHLGKRGSRPTGTVDTLATPTGTVRGRIVAPDGRPLAGVQVRAGDATATTDADGRFELTGVPVGTAEIVIEAQAPYQARRATVQVGAGTAAEVALGDVPVERALPPGQIRGVVRTLAGKPVAATVVVEPLGVTVEAGDDGAFRIDVPPGKYEVVLSAPGLATQRRQIQVEQNGVTVLNVELRAGGGSGS